LWRVAIFVRRPSLTYSFRTDAPGTKKYVGPDAVIKKDIALIDSENLAANDKKRQVEELQSKLKSPPEPVKFPANIDLVVKNYDKINAAMPPVQ
jgi:hypothetical protein